MRAPAARRARRTGPRTVSARLVAHARLEARPDGHIFARLDGYSLDLGWFSAAAAERVLELQKGQRLSALQSGGQTTDARSSP